MYIKQLSSQNQTGQGDQHPDTKKWNINLVKINVSVLHRKINGIFIKHTSMLSGIAFSIKDAWRTISYKRSKISCMKKQQKQDVYHLECLSAIVGFTVGSSLFQEISSHAWCKEGGSLCQNIEISRATPISLREQLWLPDLPFSLWLHELSCLFLLAATFITVSVPLSSSSVYILVTFLLIEGFRMPGLADGPEHRLQRVL